MIILEKQGKIRLTFWHFFGVVFAALAVNVPIFAFDILIPKTIAIVVVLSVIPLAILSQRKAHGLTDSMIRKKDPSVEGNPFTRPILSRLTKQQFRLYSIGLIALFFSLLFSMFEGSEVNIAFVGVGLVFSLALLADWRHDENIWGRK